MKKNNGFTLVELLAVIVILAIIMVLAIPAVLDTVTTSRKSSFSTYAKKTVVATDQKNTEEEMTNKISGKGIYTYSIKEDLGLSATGSYEGYVVIDNCTESEKQYYVYLADGNYMVYDFHDASNAEITQSNNFGDYDKEDWQKVAGSKEIVAAAVVNITGGYACSLYGKDGTELSVDGVEVPNLPTSSNSAVFLEGVDFAYTMLNEVAGNKDFFIKDYGTVRYIENVKYRQTPRTWEHLTDLSDMTIKEIKKVNSMTEDQKSSAKIVSTDDSPNPIYMWFDSGTVYWYTAATKVFANKNASSMFSWLGAVTTIDLSEIDFSQTTDISYIFECDKGMTSIDVSSMNVVNVTNMIEVFYAMQSLKSVDVSMWNTSNVTKVSFMFAYLESATTIKFPRTLVNKKVTEIQGLFFCDYAVKSLDVSQFDTSNIKNFYGVFLECHALENLDVSNWNTSKATDISYMFLLNEALTSLDLSKWDTSNVTDMGYMFYGAKSLVSLDLSKWDTSNVTDMSYMFCTARGIKKLNLSNFNVSKVTTFEMIFSYMDAVTSIDITNWNLGSNVNAGGMFRNSKVLKTIYVSNSWKDHIGTDTNLFLNCSKLVGGNGTKYNKSYVTKARAVIDGENGQAGYFTYKA